MARIWRGFAVIVVVILGLAVLITQFGAASADPNPYKLPWSAGERQSVMQGNSRFDDWQNCISGCATHNVDSMRFALDFALPEGTPVLAARAGTVALMNGSWRSDHCGGLSASDVGNVVSQTIGNESNFVQIDHGDGSSALYLHLSEVSADIERKAKTGEPVHQGEMLGRSGKTGFTQCVPHLHFQVEASVRADWFTSSLPVSFADRDVTSRTPGGVPVEGDTYVSDNVPVGGMG